MKLEEAITLLNENNYSCVYYNEQDIIISEDRGIKPLMQFISQDKKGYVLVDKIIGKAGAFLAVLLKCKYVYAKVLSFDAKNILEKYNIEYSYSIITERIINRTGDDICPMEKTVLNIDEPLEAYESLKEKIKSMMQKK